VSSTHIRGLIVAGDVEGASHFLGSPYQFRGSVVHGDMRGRTLGYPTANLVPSNELCYPGHGIYACRAAVLLDGTWQWWPAAVNVGVRPTFVTGRGVLIEAFLIGFEGDLYGLELRLAFLSRLRGEKRFDSVEALVEQMALDVEQAQRIAA
jgi:riboflavin kinase/FMN adenylyltransferase